MNRSALRRYLEVIALVAVWMIVGWLLGLDANEYLLAGVPLVVIFQLLVRRQPLRKLWVRDADRFSLGVWGWAIALALAIKPLFELTRVLPRELWVLSAWMLCCVAGTVPAAFALRKQNREKLVRALPSFIAAIILGFAVVAATAISRSGYVLLPWRHVGFLAGQFILYFAVGFVLEEVAFRGAIDAHIYQPNDSNEKQLVAWVSAIFVSVLWGTWHLPLLGITDASTLISAAPGLIFAHVIIGVPLSFCWRTSGTLLLPAIAHALIDAYRNTVLF
jgi:hypothetical protein